jgi:hypothetical protein
VHPPRPFPTNSADTTHPHVRTSTLLPRTTIASTVIRSGRKCSAVKSETASPNLRHLSATFPPRDIGKRNTITNTILHTTQHGILIAVGSHASTTLCYLGFRKRYAGFTSNVPRLPDISIHHLRLQDIEHATEAASTGLFLVETCTVLIAHVQPHGRFRCQLPHR